MWYYESKRNRIQSYRSWRLSLATLSTSEQLQQIAIQWGAAPRSNHYLVHDDCKNWPDPWELITDNIYCDLSVCLGMFYTAALLGKIDIESSKLLVYNDKSNWINLSSFDQGKYILNWNHQEIVNTGQLPKDLELHYSYGVKDLPFLSREINNGEATQTMISFLSSLQNQ